MSKEIDLNLKKPSKEQAKNDLREVEYDDRISGIKMHSMAGNQRHPLNSLEEVYKFIDIGNPSELLKPGGSTINYIAPKILTKWIKEVIGDEELADKISENLSEKSNFKEKSKVIQETIGKRLYQCQQTLQKSQENQ